MEDTQEDTFRKRLESMEDTNLRVEALQNGVDTSQQSREKIIQALVTCKFPTNNIGTVPSADLTGAATSELSNKRNRARLLSEEEEGSMQQEEEPPAKRQKTGDITISDIELWDIDDVYKYVTEILKLKEQNAELLKKQEITGVDLLDLTEKQLVAISFPLGPAKRLVKAMNAFKISRANQIFPSFEALCDYYISSEWQPANLYTPKPTSDVVSEIGSFFPFKNRVKSRKILLEAIQEQYNMWKNKASYSEDTFRKSLSHILVGGAPGIGKTTFTLKALLCEIEALKRQEGNSIPLDSPLVELLENCIQNGLIVSTSFTKPPKKQEQDEPDTLLLARLAHGFMRPKEKYDDFLPRFPSGSLTSLLDALVLRCKLKTPTMVVIHLDETNTVPSEFLEKVDRAAANMLCTSDYFFVLVQTGVRSTMMQAAATAASGNTDPILIPLPLLQKHHLVEITKYLLETDRISDFVTELIEYCAGNPRYLEYVLVGCSCLPSEVKEYAKTRTVTLSKLKANNRMDLNSEEKSQFLKDIVSIISRRTKLKAYLKMTEFEITKLLATELLCQQVSRDDKLLENCTIEELESDGLIFLSPTTAEDLWTVSIPYFTFHLLQSSSSMRTPRPKLMRSTSNLLQSRENEILDVSVILMKLDLLKQLGQTSFKLSDLFPLHSRAKDMEFIIPDSLRLSEMRHDVSSWVHQKFSAHLTQIEKDGFCAEVGAGSDSFPDAWIVVHHKSDDGSASKEKHVLYIQSKRRRDIGTKSTPGKGAQKESVEIEHKKCKFLPTRHTFIFITDDKQRAGDVTFEENEIVITLNDHEKFYGKCLALRKSHMI